MRKILMRLAAAAVALMAMGFIASEAQAQTIPCPLTSATRTITNTLPGEWWTTPIVSTLSDTRVTEISGVPALQCVYGTSGAIQREAPANANCTATATGFQCTPRLIIPPILTDVIIPGILELIPAVQSQGTVNVSQTFSVNFDNGAIGAGAGADLFFRAATASEMYLTPVNGAQMWVGDRSNRGYGRCRTEPFTSAEVPLVLVPTGSYVCMRTNQGRISQFRIVSTTGSPIVLRLEYTTWAL